MPELSYLEAISEAMREEMRRDERVFIMGEDIAEYGGAFKVTKGFLDEFGADRVINMPIAESGMVGAAVGAAAMGQRPIVEMQFMDFIACGFDQIVNMAAKFYYRLEIPLPIVIRGPSGGGVHGGPFHSQCPEAWFAHVPGLKVVAPATPTDAKGLLKTAIRDNNPVIYLEHKWLYRRLKERVPADDSLIPFGQAIVRRPGMGLSIVTYGAMVHHALEAAEQLAREDIDVEVLDLRTIVPLDVEAILATVRKTGKVIVLHEATLTAGFGAEIAAQISEHALDYLDGPIVRVAAPDTPVPYSAPLEACFLPDAQKIADAARKLARY
jgi:2-oxoisovalerate dehydrogenase E1 component beta subunit